MADPVTASDRLERILWILPRACREGGVSLSVLADELGVETTTLLEDLAEVTARAWYGRAGSGDDLQIHLEGDRLSVFTTGQFRRPVRLTLRESLCLALGLRHVALQGREDDGGDLRRRLLDHLAGVDPEDAVERLAAPDLDADPEGIRDTVQACARERRRCRIRYLKAGAADAETRTVHPYTLVHAEGHWYVLAWCEASRGVRVFRQDRILEARPEAGGYDIEPAFDPDDYLSGGRVYRAEEEAEAVVRYSPRIARWIRERHPDACEETDDGAVLLRHPVADPRWLVRHVLTYAPEAVVVEPESLRGLVRDAAGGAVRPPGAS